MHGCTYSTRQHWEANTPTHQNTPTHASKPGTEYSNSSPTISCSYSTQSYISTRRSVDHNPCVDTPKQPPCSIQDCDHENVYESRRMNNKQSNYLSMLIDPESSKSPRFHAFMQYIYEYQEHLKAK